jgi:hypothetical protein
MGSTLALAWSNFWRRSWESGSRDAASPLRCLTSRCCCQYAMWPAWPCFRWKTTTTPSGRDRPRGTGGVLPPFDFGQPLDYMEPFRVERVRPLKGNRAVRKLSRRETGIPVRKGLKREGLRGHLRCRQWPDRRAPVAPTAPRHPACACHDYHDDDAAEHVVSLLWSACEGRRRRAPHTRGRASPRARGGGSRHGEWWSDEAPTHRPASAVGTGVPSPASRGQWPSATQPFVSACPRPGLPGPRP